jgi:DDE family transposase
MRNRQRRWRRAGDSDRAIPRTSSHDDQRARGFDYNSGNPNGRQSAIDGRTTRHDGYGMSQSCRAMAECIFGWGKQHGTMRKTKHRGPARVTGDFLLNLIAYNLVRIPRLIAA